MVNSEQMHKVVTPHTNQEGTIATGNRDKLR